MPSEKSRLLIKKLDIMQMPGLPKGLRAYEDFAPNINIIAGPNASGKSSTAHAIQQLIWRTNANDIRAEAECLLEDEPWSIKLDFGRYSVKRNGVEGELNGLPAAEERHRYLLALHHLVDVDVTEEELARRIIRESIGGYDLERAREDLGYSTTIYRSNKTAFGEFDEAREKVQENWKEQQKLKHRDQSLEELEKEREEAEEAQRKKELFERYIAYLQAEKLLEKIQSEFEKFPSALEKTTGEELDEIDKLNTSVDEQKEILRNANAERGQHREELDKLNLPDDAIENEDLARLEEKTNNLQQKRDRIEHLEEEVDSLKAKEQHFITNTLQEDPEHWEELDPDAADELDTIFRELYPLFSKKHVLDQEIEELKESQPEVDSNTLWRATRLLRLWLRASNSQEARDTHRWIYASVAAAVLTSVAVYSWGVFGFLGLILVVILLIADSLLSSSGKIRQKSRIREDDFKETGLTPPEEWNRDAVEERLKELYREIAKAEVAEENLRRLEDRRKRREQLEEQLDETIGRYDQFYGRITGASDISPENMENYSGVYWFLRNAFKWKQIKAERVEQERKLKKQREAFEKVLNQCNHIFEKYDLESVEDADTARSKWKTLQEKEQERSKLSADVNAADDKIEHAEKRIGELEKELQSIYRKLNLEYGDRKGVKELIEQRSEYEEVQKNLNIARNDYERAEEELKEFPLYEEYEEELSEMTLEQARQRKERYKNEAARLKDINNRITEINTVIREKKKSHDLEEALTEKEEAVERLKQLYMDNISSVTGALLIDQLKRFAREQSRSKVFQRASELFNQITGGRYKLDIGEGEGLNPEFMARDQILNKNLRLNQLSSGTRIQLLLSVRIAFVETQEQTVKLPLLADELLANSDDVRARAVIQALIELSRDGRQIFYFTAQADELDKWKQHLLDTEDLSYEVFTLTGDDERESDDSYSQPERSAYSLVSDLPAPESMDMEEYGEQLKIPDFNIMGDEVEQLHLWYLMGQPELLYRCLRRGISRWGALQSFYEHGGTIDKLDRDRFKRLKEKAEILEEFQRLYRKGRPYRIDRSVLEQTDAVTEKFIDEVAETLKRVEGDPEKLLEALENKEVKGFLERKKQELRDFLLEKGYIDEFDPLDEKEIRTRLQVQITNSQLSPEEVEHFLQKVLQQ